MCACMCSARPRKEASQADRDRHGGREAEAPTDEPQGGLRERQGARVEQQVQAVRAVLQREHAQHHQQEARLRGRPQARARGVLVGDGLQRDRLDTWGASGPPKFPAQRAGFVRTTLFPLQPADPTAQPRAAVSDRPVAPTQGGQVLDWPLSLLPRKDFSGCAQTNHIRNLRWGKGHTQQCPILTGSPHSESRGTTLGARDRARSAACPLSYLFSPKYFNRKQDTSASQVQG